MANNLAMRILISAQDKASSVVSALAGSVTKLTAGIAAVSTAAAGWVGAKLFGDSVDAAEQLQKEMGAVRGAIEATGGAAGLTAEDIDAMARRLDEATLGSASGFRKASVELLTFKSVAGDTFERTLMLAQDLADSGFGTVETATVQLGKALEDPVAGLGALRRVGVTFTAEQQALIQSLVAAGDAAKAQGVILDAVAGQVGGVASSMGAGLSGAIDLVGKRFTDLKEQLGEAMVPVLTEINNRLADLYKRLAESGAVSQFGASIAAAFKSGFEAAVNFVTALDWAGMLASLQAFAAQSGAHLKAFAQTLSDLGDTGTRVAGGLSAVWNGLVGSLQTVVAWVFRAKQSLDEIGLAVDEKLAKIGLVSEASLAKTRAAIEAAKATYADLSAQADASFARMETGWTGATEGPTRAKAPVEAITDVYAEQKAILDALVMAEEAQAIALAGVAQTTVEAHNATADMVAALQAARDEYERLIAAGDAQGAAETRLEIERLTAAVRALQQAQAGTVEAIKAEADQRVTHLRLLQAEAEARGDTTAAARLEAEILKVGTEALEQQLERRQQELETLRGSADANAAAIAAKEKEVIAIREAIAEKAQETGATGRMTQAQQALDDGLQRLIGRREEELVKIAAAHAAIQEEGDARADQLRALADEADGRGETTQAAHLQAQAMQAEADTARDLVSAKALELQQEQALYQAKVIQVNLDGQVTEEEQQQLDVARERVTQRELELEQLQRLANAKQNDANQADANADALERMGDQAQAVGIKATHMQKLYETALADIESANAGVASAIDGIMQSMDSWVGKISQIRALSGSDFVGLDSLGEAQAALADLTAQAEEARATANRLGDQVGKAFNYFGAFYDGLGAMYALKAEALEAEAALQRLEIQAEQLDQAMDALGNQFDDGELGLSEYLAKLQQLRGQYANLTDEDLEALEDKIRDVKDEMADMADTGTDGLRDLQAEWADYRGEIVKALRLEQESERLEVEMALIEAKRNGNAEEIAALTEKLALLKEYQAAQLEQAALEEAQAKIDAAEEAAAEAERRASLSAEERRYEDAIASLKGQLAEAIVAQDAALQALILAQIEAEKQRHALAMEHAAQEVAARSGGASDTDTAASAASASASSRTTTTTASAASGATPASGAAPPSTRSTPAGGERTVRVVLGNSGSVSVPQGQEQTLLDFIEQLATATGSGYSVH